MGRLEEEAAWESWLVGGDENEVGTSGETNCLASSARFRGGQVVSPSSLRARSSSSSESVADPRTPWDATVVAAAGTCRDKHKARLLAVGSGSGGVRARCSTSDLSRGSHESDETSVRGTDFYAKIIVHIRQKCSYLELDFRTPTFICLLLVSSAEYHKIYHWNTTQITFLLGIWYRLWKTLYVRETIVYSPFYWSMAKWPWISG